MDSSTTNTSGGRWPLPPDQQISVDLLQKVIAESPVAIAVLEGLDFRHVIANPAFLISARGKRDIIGRTVSEVWPEIAAEVLPLLQQVAIMGETIQAQNAAFKLDRGHGLEEAYFTFTISRISKMDPLLLMIVATETTESLAVQRRLEQEQLDLQQALKQASDAEQKTREILNSITESYFFLDRAWRFCEINRAALNYLEKKPYELLGKSIWDVYPAQKGTYVEEHYLRALAEMKPVHFELKSVSVPRWADVHVYPSEDGVAIYFTDITERKIAEESAFQAVERLDLAAEIGQIGIWDWFLTENRLEWDARMKALFAFPTEVGVSVEDWMARVHPDDRERILALSQKGMDGQAPFEFEYRLVLPDGGHRLVYARGKTLQDHAGLPYRMTGVAIDMTSARQAEEETVLNRAEIEMQHRLMDQREQERLQLARDLHDGPVQELIGISFSLQELLAKTSDPHQVAQINRIHDQVQRQIEELRGFSVELRPPVLVNFGLEKAIRSHVGTLKQRYPHLRFYLDMRQEKGILPEDVRLVMYRIYQEAMNNIIRHSGANRVTVRFVRTEYQAVMEVIDDGAGFRLPTRWLDLAREGHLGLVGMRERAEAIGGALHVESRPGEGTRIRVTVSYDHVVT